MFCFSMIIKVFRERLNMITLRGKLKKDNDITNSKNNNRRVSIRDKLLIKEVFIITRFVISYILMLIMIYMDYFN